jgi:23S rRNA pseudouridine2605 synthase
LRGFERDAHCPVIMVHDPLRPQTDEPGQAETEGGDRVAKTLARAGVGSRRDVERLIAEGRVAVNGRVLDTPAVRIEPGDIVTVDGEVVGEPEPARLFRYHKPVGLVTTHKDPASRPTVFKALPEGLPRLISVGRLDLNSEGLLLLTNDGELARALESPATGIVRRYRVRAYGRTSQEALDRLASGVTVDGVRYGPIEARLDKVKEGREGANLWITVTLHEGKNREVRKVLESIGLKVNRLIRLAYGPLALGTLDEGEIEEVGPRVIREQFAQYIDPANLPRGERPQYRSPARKTRRATEAAAAAAMTPAAPEEKPAKKSYKPGWAKAKPKARPHPAPRRKGPNPDKAKGPDTAWGPVRSAEKRSAKAARPMGSLTGKTGGKLGGKPAASSAARLAESPRAAGPGPGPRGPKTSTSPQRTSAARPPSPPRSGGRGPRG